MKSLLGFGLILSLASPLALSQAVTINEHGVSVGDMIKITDGEVSVGDLVHIKNKSKAEPKQDTHPSEHQSEVYIEQGDTYFDDNGRIQDLNDRHYVNEELKRVDLSNRDLSYSNFTNAELTDVNLSNTNLTGSLFINTDIRRSNLSGANLQGACFINIEMRDVALSGANIAGSAWVNYSFRRTVLDGINKDAAYWDDSQACQDIKHAYKLRQASVSEYSGSHAQASNAHIVVNGNNTMTTISSNTPQRAEITSSKVIVAALAEEPGTKIDLTVNFKTDQDVLFGNAHAQVQEIAKALRSDEMANQSVLIEGHTDSDGDYDYNLDLSYRRASTVMATLINQYKIDPDRLAIEGHGEQLPIASNDDAFGKAINRRVTLIRSE